MSLNPLSDSDMEKIHSASLTLLGDLGVSTESPLVLDLFRQAGARVDQGRQIIHLPPDLVEHSLDTAPSSFTLFGRHNPDMNLLLEPGRVHYGMGGASEPLFWDYDLWNPRKPTKDDMVRNTRVGQALPNIDFVQALCMSADKPMHQIFYHDFDAIFRNTTKPTVINILERPFTVRLLEMTAAASGGEDALRCSPSVLGLVTPISPLVFASMNEGIVDAVQAGVPILYSPGPMMGATGPATVAGTMALSLAEVLFGLVLVQLISPGAPVVLKPDTNVFDMRTAQCTNGSPEQNLGRAAMAQLARHYELPIYHVVGGVEAKVPDAEAASQATMGILLNGMAGTTLCQSLGTLASGLYGSPEMTVICDEIVHMAKRVFSGFDVTSDTLAVDVVQEVGCGGTFLSHDHTVRHFRGEMFFPQLFARQSAEQWQDGGGLMAHQVAHQRVLEILREAEPVPLPPGVDYEMERALDRALRKSKAV